MNKVFIVFVPSNEVDLQVLFVSASSAEELVKNLGEVFCTIDKKGNKRYHHQNMVRRIQEEAYRYIKELEGCFTDKESYSTINVIKYKK